MKKLKCLIKLAEIIIILAGFLFTLSGIFFTSYTDTYNSSINTINNMILQHESINDGKVIIGDLDFTYKLGNELESNWKQLKFYSKLCFLLGILFTFISLGIWYKCYKLCK